MWQLPGGFRLRLRDEAAEGAVPLALGQRRIWPAGLITGAMFAAFAAAGWSVASTLWRSAVRNVSDLMVFLFQGFWLLGWSVGVFALGALTVFLFLYRESARLQGGRLVCVSCLGPIRIIVDYDLARIRNVRLQDVNGPENVQVRFDCDERVNNTLGDTMPRADAERLAKTIEGAAAAAGARPGTGSPVLEKEAEEEKGAVPLLPVKEVRPVSQDAPAAPDTRLSAAMLVVANLMPLAGVLFFGWDLANVMVLFWAESAVIGFYTVLKMLVTGRLWAIFGVVFFLGHFGGFMAMHFMFIYLMFIRGIHAVGPEPGVRDALLRIFVPLWIPLAALFVSHGVSFVSNFIGQREYERTSVQALMAAPYGRIVAMQLTVIVGGWVVLLLNNPVPALALLVLLKTAMDFRAHKNEHARR
jgi:hypothetical protein